MAKKSETDLFAPVGDDPRVAAAEVTLAEARVRLREVEETLENVTAALNGAHGGTGVDAAASALLAGKSTMALRDELASMVAESAAAERDVAVATRAVALATERLSRIRQAVREERLPEITAAYRGLVGRIAEALMIVKRLSVEERAFRERLNGVAGEDLKLFPTHIRPVPVPVDDYRVASLLADAHEYGLLGPEPLRTLVELEPVLRGQFAGQLS